MVELRDLLPPLSDEEYEALKADSAERGVQVPVEVDEDGNILDGHHRVRAAEELGITDWPRVIRVGMTEEEKVQGRRLRQLRGRARACGLVYAAVRGP